jgi:hypothetical protein
VAWRLWKRVQMTKIGVLYPAVFLGVWQLGSYSSERKEGVQMFLKKATFHGTQKNHYTPRKDGNSEIY